MAEKELISYLAKVNHQNPDKYSYLSLADQVRAWMNITYPRDLSPEFYQEQDQYLQERLSHLKVTDVNTLSFKDRLCVYRGDITLLKADAIVNAGNPELLGCFVECHSCIDNAIHSYSGLQVRRDLMAVMAKQGHEEPTGQVKVTLGYNLPSRYIFHTVGPVADDPLSDQNRADLCSCYLACLKEAQRRQLTSLVFCSLSTGVYGFPIEQASRIAVDTVRSFLKTSSYPLKVVFDVFSERDYRIYVQRVSES
jgi:O-acetyl-ADP-ribose deacetylase (regulator of RNase III)